MTEEPLEEEWPIGMAVAIALVGVFLGRGFSPNVGASVVGSDFGHVLALGIGALVGWWLRCHGAAPAFSTNALDA